MGYQYRPTPGARSPAATAAALHRCEFTVALRMSWYGQSVVPTSTTVPVMIGAFFAGVLFVLGARQLNEQR